MIGLIYKLIIGTFHLHQWETVDEFRMKYTHEFSSGVADVKVMKCKTCGCWKKKKLY